MGGGNVSSTRKPCKSKPTHSLSYQRKTIQSQKVSSNERSNSFDDCKTIETKFTEVFSFSNLVEHRRKTWSDFAIPCNRKLVHIPSVFIQNRCQHFLIKCGGCLGEIDGKNTNIWKPEHSGTDYYNYKGFFSIVLLGVVDANYKFISAEQGNLWLNQRWWCLKSKSAQRCD